MSEHSPLPWVADPDDREGMEWNIHILDATGDRVCFMTSDGPAEINADLIIRSVNLLPELVEDLEAITRGITSVLLDAELKDQTIHRAVLQTVLDDLGVTLSKARAGASQS